MSACEIIKILGYHYKIISQNDRKTMGGNFGIHQAAEEVIQIANDLNQEQFVSTILHEMLHAISYHLGLSLSEPIVSSLESAIFQCLIDNGVDLSPLCESRK